MRRSRRQHLFFAIDQIARIETRQLESMAMRNRIGGTGLHTIPTKYTSIIVDVVDAGVAFGARNPGLSGVFRGFYVDAVRGAGGGTEETGYTLFQPVFVALQDVHAAKAFLKLCAFQRAGTVGIVLNDGRLKHLDGAGKPEHFYEALTTGGASAALAASLFHFGELTIPQLKTYLRERGVVVR